MNEKEIESLLDEAKTARLCTHNEDGTIHAVPVWFRYDHDAKRILIGAPAKSRKARNARRNGDVTVLLEVEGPQTRGLIVYGKAEVSELDPGNLITEGMPEFTRYMPEKDAIKYAKALDRLTKWVKVSIAPVRYVSFDYSKDEVFRKALQEEGL
jgi:hypothetical protein